MICRQCLHIASRGTSLNTSSSLNTIGRRQFSTSPSSFLSNTASSYGRAAVTPKQRVPKTAATSTETADSDPAATISEVSKKKAGRGTPANAPISISSVPAGTPLKGLNFMKSGSDPVALEDHEYPSWLWDILKKEEKKADEGLEGDLFAKSKKQRRIAAKRLRKQQLLNPELLAPKIPLYEQSIDLPSGNGTVEGSLEAEKSREELTKAMRGNRRGQIKEDNFLRAMR